MHHLVFPKKYTRVVFDGEVEAVLKEECLDNEKRYEVKFLEIWAVRYLDPWIEVVHFKVRVFSICFNYRDDVIFH